jgi:TolA-binding protein
MSKHNLDTTKRKGSLQESEVKEVLDFIRKYAVPTVVVIVLCCGTFLFFSWMRSSKAAREVKADSALMNAMDATDYQRIIDEYESTASAPIAMMNLAMTRFSDGAYDAAQELYTQFLQRYGNHEMALQAELNVITCREAKGELSEAHLLYGEFADKHRDSYLAPLAIMGQARCLEGMESMDEARRAYEDLIVAYPGSSWAEIANTRMTVISKKLK